MAAFLGKGIPVPSMMSLNSIAAGALVLEIQRRVAGLGVRDLWQWIIKKVRLLSMMTSNWLLMMNVVFVGIELGRRQKMASVKEKCAKLKLQKKDKQTNFASENYEKAKDYYSNGEFTHAIEELTKVIGLNYKKADAYVVRGICYTRLENYNLALDDLNEAIQLNPKSDVAYVNRGICYSKQKKYDFAESDFSKAIELNPKSVSAYSNLGYCFVEQGKDELALSNQYKAIELSENIPKEQIYDMLKQSYKSVHEANKQKENAYRAIHDKEIEMLSFFTHTMHNALATAPESLRQAIQLLGSDVYEKDTKHYQAINKIASLFSTLTLTDCLIDTFKQSVSDPQEFKQAWENDHTGDATPSWVIAAALRQSLNRIFFMSDASDLKKLLAHPEAAQIKATRKSFIDEVLPLNSDQQGVNRLYAWVNQHVQCIDVSISDTDGLKFGANKTRFSLLFAITSELILNALRYWDGEDKIQISWLLADTGHFVFSVKNHCKPNATSNLAGTHKGLAFIKRLIELLGTQARFDFKTEEGYFTAELALNKTLLGDKQ